MFIKDCYGAAVAKKKINYKAFKLPNITFYLDLDPKIALERLYKK
ncbi:hypothetical protein [Texas Phoenix palm phytoplasma]|nr:hypothetical protein [Texas Phoenix palm phytoplasma]